MIGEQLGNYRIVRQLGEGGMGVVYLAEHAHLRRQAAVKVLHNELGHSRDMLERFLAEAQATAALRHPGIVEVLDCGFHTNGQAYIVMEFLEGRSLGQHLIQGGRLGMHDLALVGSQIAEAVGAAHAHRLVHRDLKPENVYLVEGRLDRVKVLDFGIAKLLGDPGGNKRTRTGTVLGTPAYMSPEQCRGTGEIDHRADIYSLGCVLYEMACGRLPFTYAGTGELLVAHLNESPPPPRALSRDVPPALESLLLRMLGKSPDDRPPHMRAVAAELSGLGQQSFAAAPAGSVMLGDARAPTAPTVQLDARVGTLAPKRPDTTLGGAAGARLATTTTKGSSRVVWSVLAAALLAGGGWAARSTLLGAHRSTQAPAAAIEPGVQSAEPSSEKPATSGDRVVDPVQPAVRTGKKKRVAASDDGAGAPSKSALSALAAAPPFSHKLRSLAALPGAADDPRQERLADIIGCLNEVSARARDSFTRYHSWVKDLVEGPTGHEPIIYGLYSLNGVEGCHERLGRYERQAQDDLERTAGAYDRAMRALDRLTTAADHYYEQKDYADDAFAEGKRLHPRLVVAFHDLSEADARLRGLVDKETETVRKGHHAKADDGSPIGQKNAVLELAEQVMRTAEKEDKGPARLTAEVASYEKTLAHAKEVGEAGSATAAIFWWDPFLHEADDFLAAAKRRSRKLRDGDDFSDSERMLLRGGGAWMVKGSSADLERMYQRLLDAAKNVRRQ